MPKEGGKKPSPAQLPNLILPIWVVHVPIGLQNLRQTIFLELKYINGRRFPEDCLEEVQKPYGPRTAANR